MDWLALAPLVTALAGATGASASIVAARSRGRLLERLAIIGEKLPPESTALRDVRDLQDRLASDLLAAYRPPGSWRAAFGFSLSLLTLLTSAGSTASGVLLRTSDPHGSPAVANVLILVGAGLAVAGLVIYIYALTRLRDRRAARRPAPPRMPRPRPQRLTPPGHGGAGTPPRQR